MTAPAALAELERIAANRHTAVADQLAAGGAVIAHLGADVPRPLLAATGAVPVRLFPRGHRAACAAPDRAGEDIDEATAALGRTVDPRLAPLVANIASGALGAPVVIDHSAADHLRAHQTVGWLRRGGSRPNDDVHFVDLLHVDRPVTRAYDLGQLRTLAAWAGQQTGTAATDERLNAAFEAGEHQRRATAEVLALRRAAEPRLSGTQALAVVRAGSVLDAERHVELLDELVESADRLPPVAVERRAYVVGAAPDGGYESLERLGYHVAGEDHDEGARCAVAAPDQGDDQDRVRDGDSDDPLALLVDRHFAAPGCPTRLDPARRIAAIERDLDTLAADTLIVDRVDAVTRWMLPALRRLAATRGCGVVEWNPRAADS